jgi:hypothetical protein
MIAIPAGALVFRYFLTQSRSGLPDIRLSRPHQVNVRRVNRLGHSLNERGSER